MNILEKHTEVEISMKVLSELEGMDPVDRLAVYQVLELLERKRNKLALEFFAGLKL